MKEYTKRRRQLGKTKEEVAAAMGVKKHTYKRIEQGYGNTFEDACIRANLQLPERTEKQTLIVG